ncbi:DNA adenine methylase [Draconibacterium sp.]|jgi:DNA adenine methylase
MNTPDLNNATKPFLKWAGGKSQLLDKFLDFYPAELKNGEITNYYEPFVGGGAVFFDVAQRFNIKSAVLCDINPELILTYRVIQQDVDKLIEALHTLKKLHTKLDEEAQSKFYYEIRDEFNQNHFNFNYINYSDSWILRAAQIIFMNKTCFNGLFRFNQKGEFNVPAGRYKNPKILDESNLLNVSKLLSIAEIRNAGFETIENEVKENSFVYFDPPYRPISKTSTFTAYSKHKFEDDEQRQLTALFHSLNKKGIKQMLSNSDPKNNDPEDNFFDELYAVYHISRIPARRMINSDASKRNAINEIVVTNY